MKKTEGISWNEVQEQMLMEQARRGCVDYLISDSIKKTDPEDQDLEQASGVLNTEVVKK